MRRGAGFRHEHFVDFVAVVPERQPSAVSVVSL
jgi:hypothetical protein